MYDWTGITLSIGGGTLLGLFYFGGLWWTTNQLRTTSRPGRLYLFSLTLRLGLLLSCLLLLIKLHVVYFFAAFVGFLVVRWITTSRVCWSTETPVAQVVTGNQSTGVE